MPSLKAIKRRIASVSNTQQIMKAMNMVSASKVHKNKLKMEAIKPLFDDTKDFFDQGIAFENQEDNIYFASRSRRSTAYIVISGERGLCGSYNSNVLKAALSHMENENIETKEKIITIGAKGKDFFVRRNKNVVDDHPGVLENISYSVAEDIAVSLTKMFVEDDENLGNYDNHENQGNLIDEIYIVYTQFETLLSHIPTVVKLLPFEPSVPENVIESDDTVIYEPDVYTYLKKAVPIYLAMYIYGAMVEASVCEQASRMISMDAAARNAEEIVDDLTLLYNRQRQSVITQEISEIVGGANAI